MVISVYITSFNKGEFLSQAITSILNQSLPPNELIIVDDCSIDNSKEIIEEYVSQYPELIKPIFNEINLGISKSRNIAISHCKGDIISFVDADDYFFQSKLESEFQLLNNSNYGCVYSNHVSVDKDGNILDVFAEKDDVPAEGNIFLENFKRNFYVSSGANFHNEMFFKSHAIEIGLYDENIQIWEDWDFRIRMSKEVKYGYCPNVNSAYRISQKGLHNSNIKLHYHEQLKIYKKNKHLLKHINSDNKLLIKNRLFSKLKNIYSEIIIQIQNNGNYFILIYYYFHFIFAFKTKKSISFVLELINDKKDITK